MRRILITILLVSLFVTTTSVYAQQYNGGQPCPTTGVWPSGCIPSGTPTQPPSGQPCPTTGVWPSGCIPSGTTPTQPPEKTIVINNIQYITEIAVLKNVSDKAINLQGYRLSASDGQWADLKGWLQVNQTCNVYRNSEGTNSCGSFESQSNIWNNDEECGSVYDKQSNQIDLYCYQN